MSNVFGKFVLIVETPFYVEKFKIKHLQECCSLMSNFEIEIPVCVNLRNYLVDKVVVQMGQMGLVAVDLVAGTCQAVVGAKKKYLLMHN